MQYRACTEHNLASDFSLAANVHGADNSKVTLEPCHEAADHRTNVENECSGSATDGNETIAQLKALIASYGERIQALEKQLPAQSTAAPAAAKASPASTGEKSASETVKDKVSQAVDSVKQAVGSATSPAAQLRLILMGPPGSGPSRTSVSSKPSY